MDLVLFDLKEIDPGRHRDVTGQDNETILGNLLLADPNPRMALAQLRQEHYIRGLEERTAAET